MTEAIKGVIAPVVTPLDDEGNLVLERVENGVEYTLECGCHAVVASGTGVQETAALSPAERKDLISATIAAVDGRVPVLAGVSYPAQPIVSDLVTHAEAEGADAVLAMPPWGVTPSQGAIVRYYESVAAESDLPILAYNNPSVTIDMAKETMRDVARIDGVDYVKESSRDWQKIGWLLETVHHEGLAEVFTTMDVFLPTLQSGGSGIVTPAPLSAPSMEIYDAYHEKDLNHAIEVQRTFGDFPPEAADVGLTGVCKAATQLAGVDVGPPRPPYDALSEEGREAVHSWMDEVGIPRL